MCAWRHAHEGGQHHQHGRRSSRRPPRSRRNDGERGPALLLRRRPFECGREGRDRLPPPATRADFRQRQPAPAAPPPARPGRPGRRRGGPRTPSKRARQRRRPLALRGIAHKPSQFLRQGLPRQVSARLDRPFRQVQQPRHLGDAVVLDRRQHGHDAQLLGQRVHGSGHPLLLAPSVSPPPRPTRSPGGHRSVLTTGPPPIATLAVEGQPERHSCQPPRKRSRSRSDAKARCARRKASCATSSASSRRRSTPRATRKARLDESTIRSSNSRSSAGSRLTGGSRTRSTASFSRTFEPSSCQTPPPRLRFTRKAWRGRRPEGAGAPAAPGYWQACR